MHFLPPPQFRIRKVQNNNYFSWYICLWNIVKHYMEWKAQSACSLSLVLPRMMLFVWWPDQVQTMSCTFVLHKWKCCTYHLGYVHRCLASRIHIDADVHTHSHKHTPENAGVTWNHFHWNPLALFLTVLSAHRDSAGKARHTWALLIRQQTVPGFW